MTWLAHQILTVGQSYRASLEHMWSARRWCEHNLSSNGVLWKHDHTTDWAIFYFAQPQDLIIFKLKFG